MCSSYGECRKVSELLGTGDVYGGKEERGLWKELKRKRLKEMVMMIMSTMINKNKHRR